MTEISHYAKQIEDCGSLLDGVSIYRYTAVLPGFIAYGSGVELVEGAFGLALHSDLPSFLFDMTPLISISDDDEIDAMDAKDFWALMVVEDHYVERMIGSANDCYEIVNLAIQEGYDREEDGWFGIWVMNRMAEVIGKGVCK